MSRITIVAAGGASKRTGLGEYTTKAALPVDGQPLLTYQIDFARKAGCDRVLVVCRPEHARLLGSILVPEDRKLVAFVMSDTPTGWAGEVERCLAHVADDDKVLIIPCDNIHGEDAGRFANGVLSSLDIDGPGGHTYARCESGPLPVESALVKAKSVWGQGADAWIAVRGASREAPTSGAGGGPRPCDFFAGFVFVRGDVLREGLAKTQLVEGKKEMVDLLAILNRYAEWVAVPYPGTYDDVADLKTIARLDALALGEIGWDRQAQISASVLVRDQDRVLLVKEKTGWRLPGCFVDSGESYVHAAIRGIEQETGVGVRENELRLLGVYPAMLTAIGTSEAVAAATAQPAATVVFHATEFTRLLVASPEIPPNFGYSWIPYEQMDDLVILHRQRGAIDDLFSGLELDCR